MSSQRQTARAQSATVAGRSAVERHGLWVRGEPLMARDGGWFPVENPYTQMVVAEVVRGGEAEAVAAVEAAAEALPSWSSLPPNERANTLQRAYRLVREHREQLTHLLVEEGGKVLAEAAK